MHLGKCRADLDRGWHHSSDCLHGGSLFFMLMMSRNFENGLPGDIHLPFNLASTHLLVSQCVPAASGPHFSPKTACPAIHPALRDFLIAMDVYLKEIACSYASRSPVSYHVPRHHSFPMLSCLSRVRNKLVFRLPGQKFGPKQTPPLPLFNRSSLTYRRQKRRAWLKRSLLSDAPIPSHILPTRFFAGP